jgi:hypothetical protein
LLRSLRRPPQKGNNRICLSRVPGPSHKVGVADKRVTSHKGWTPNARPEHKFGYSEWKRLRATFATYKRYVGNITNLALQCEPSTRPSRKERVMAFNSLTIKLPSSPYELRKSRRSAFFRKPEPKSNLLLWRLMVVEKRIPSPLIEEMAHHKMRRISSLQLKRAISRNLSSSKYPRDHLRLRVDEVDQRPFERVADFLSPASDSSESD